MINAVIFDMDGVISDTQKLHAEVESELLQRYGITIAPEEITRKYAGVRTADFFNDLLNDKNINIKALLEEKWERMINLARENTLEIKGAINLIASLNSNGFPLAVASASRIDFVKTVLNSLKLNCFFSQVVSAEEVKNGKPAPDVFLLAAEKLGKNPAECLVIEDGRSGMEGAKRAGMKCIGLVDDLSGQYPTEILVVSLSDLTLEKIKNL